MNNNNYRTLVATLASGAAVDSKIELLQNGARNLIADNKIPGIIIGLSVKSNWNTSNIVLGTYNPINDAYDKVCDSTTGNEIEYPVANGRYIPVDPDIAKGLKQIHIYSRTSGADVNRTAATEVLIHIVDR